MPFASRLYGACPGRSNGWSRRSRRQKWRDVKDIPPYLAWVEGGRGRRNSKCDSPNHTLPFPCHLVPRIKYFATTARSLVWSSSLAVRSVIAPAAQADARKTKYRFPTHAWRRERHSYKTVAPSPLRNTIPLDPTSRLKLRESSPRLTQRMIKITSSHTACAKRNRQKYSP